MSNAQPRTGTVQHREHLAGLITAARQRNGGRDSYYLSGYCPNSPCNIREVLVYVKDDDAPDPSSIREFRCPSCQSLLLFGAYGFGAEMQTGREYTMKGDDDARNNVAGQLFRETSPHCGMLADRFRTGTTLDDLQGRFRARGDKTVVAR